MEKYSYNDPATLPLVHKCIILLCACSFEAASFLGLAQLSIIFCSHAGREPGNEASFETCSELSCQSISCMDVTFCSCTFCADIISAFHT